MVSAMAPLLHVRNEFRFTVRAAYEAAAPLFGPEGERAWAGDDWDPQFIHPSPARDVEGAVFAVRRGGDRAIWVNTKFDLAGRHIQYVYFLPDVLVTKIDVHFESGGEETTHARVIYERTALSLAANARVEELGNGDRESGPEWEAAIDAYLRRARGGA